VGHRTVRGRWGTGSPAAGPLVLPLGCLALALVLPGCYRYTPTSFDAVTPSVEIRATLTSEKALELESLLGVLHPQLQGEVLEHRGEILLLGVPQLQGGLYPVSSGRIRQWLWFEESDFLRLETRTLDTKRTGLFAGVTGALVGYALYRALGGGAVDTDEPGNGGVNPDRTIHLRIPFR
jgi:hypothetical protein